MSWFYRHLIRPLLFMQDPEKIHGRTVHALGRLGASEFACSALQSIFGAPNLATEVLGLKFPNPIGLAAGMDKTAEALPAWEALGFGFSELGAVTWLPQPGNPSPRIFRAIADEAIINRMGFNNPGAEAFAAALDKWRKRGRWPKHPVGINLGKSKVTPLDKAAEDYANSFRSLLPFLDFFVVNVSSPNTPNLRQLQDKSALDEILAAMQEVQIANPGSSSNPPASQNKPKPVLVKVAPDLAFEALDEILELVVSRDIAGIIATNTTISRPETNDSVLSRIYAEAGGLSGRPLRARSTEVIRHLYRQTQGKLPVIGVGGVFDGESAWEKITAGACLIQIYTCLVYEGPSVASAIVRGLLQRMERAGIRNLEDAVGLANR